MAAWAAESRQKPAPLDPDEAKEIIVRAMISPFRAMDDFLDDGLRRGWSARTISTYRRILYEFGERLPIDYDVKDISTEDVRRYLGSKKKLKRGTIAHAESVLSSWLKWCYMEGKIKTNPMGRLERTKRQRAEDLDVTTVSTEDVPKMIAAARTLDVAASTDERRVWTHIVCVMVLTYLGPRRQAVANLRRRDYDRKHGRIRFREKGDKTIWKPVPTDLATLLNEADDAGVWEKQVDLLIPPPPYAFYSDAVLDGREERDGRAIWVLVKKIGAKAGVETHVHALRAAFAVFYLTRNPGDIKGLQELLGHSNIATTVIYLRKLEKATAMEPVRDLSWGEAV